MVKIFECKNCKSHYDIAGLPYDGFGKPMFTEEEIEDFSVGDADFALEEWDPEDGRCEACHLEFLASIFGNNLEPSF